MHSIMFGIEFILLSSFFCVLHGFSYGPPLSLAVCDTLEPFEHIRRAMPNPALDYEIVTERDFFQPEQVLRLTIRSPTERLFKGFVMHVVGENNERKEIAGSFLTPLETPGSKIYDCYAIVENSQANNTVTHSSPEPKSYVSFHWITPPSCAFPTYTVRAAVVEQVDVIQTSIEKEILCENSDIDRFEEPTEYLDSPENVTEKSDCFYSNLHTSIGNEYATSFETRDMNGWINMGWRRRSGRTLSLNTGPDGAADGSYYMYYEASLKPEPVLQAYLQTRHELRGCFCIRFKHHHNCDNNRNHKLSVKAGGEVLYETTDNNPEWEEMALQVDTEESARVEIVATRGDNYRGDMAIDDLRLENGWC